MRIALSGYGKMGREIEQVAVERGHTVVCRYDSQEDWNNWDMDQKNVDVVIEFSMPNSVMNNIFKCFDANLPVVVGTTGWFDQLEHVREVCEEHGKTLFYASNFSLGVNIFFELNRRLAAMMHDHEQYDVSIEETHHQHKVDAPSGTAIHLANDIIDHLGRKDKWVNRDATLGYELGVVSHRKGEVHGTHTVKYSSGSDQIEIIHTAHDRKGFAVGAVLAAEYIQHHRAGIYTMTNMLNDPKFHGLMK